MPLWHVIFGAFPYVCAGCGPIRPLYVFLSCHSGTRFSAPSFTFALSAGTLALSSSFHPALLACDPPRLSVSCAVLGKTNFVSPYQIGERNFLMSSPSFLSFLLPRRGACPSLLVTAFPSLLGGRVLFCRSLLRGVQALPKPLSGHSPTRNPQSSMTGKYLLLLKQPLMVLSSISVGCDPQPIVRPPVDSRRSVS